MTVKGEFILKRFLLQQGIYEHIPVTSSWGGICAGREICRNYEIYVGVQGFRKLCKTGAENRGLSGSKIADEGEPKI